MDFRICTLGHKIRYDVYSIPFENPNYPLNEIWEMVEKLWMKLCFDRDTSKSFMQHRLNIKKGDITKINRWYEDQWFFPSNAYTFISTMIEWCDEYLPSDIGKKALKEIFFIYDIAHAAHYSYATKDARAHKFAMPLNSPTLLGLFGYDFINAVDYFSPGRCAHTIMESTYLANSHIHEYKGCMRYCINDYYAPHAHKCSEVPIVFLNHCVCRALFYDAIMEGVLRNSEAIAIPAFYLTITALQKYHYGDFDDPLTDIEYFWTAMRSLSQTDPDSLLKSYQNLRAACNDLEHGAMSFRSSLV